MTHVMVRVCMCVCVRVYVCVCVIVVTIVNVQVDQCQRSRQGSYVPGIHAAAYTSGTASLPLMTVLQAGSITFMEAWPLASCPPKLWTQGITRCPEQAQLQRARARHDLSHVQERLWAGTCPHRTPHQQLLCIRMWVPRCVFAAMCEMVASNGKVYVYRKHTNR